MPTPTYRIGDCVEVLKEFPENHFDACVTDPPYGLEFMGKEWDRLWSDPDPSFEVRPKGGTGPFDRRRASFGTDTKAMQTWHTAWAREVLRVLKPGAHLLAFGGTRTHHRLTCALEDAGFEIRDCLMWLYGSGFPKSLDVSKAIDKAAGAEREVVRTIRKTPSAASENMNEGWRRPWAEDHPKTMDLTAPATDAAKQWSGWGTALKPAWEPIILARKPLQGTVAENVLKWGTGGLNVDGGRIESGTEHMRGTVGPAKNSTIYGAGAGLTPKEGFVATDSPLGRWPANLILDEESAAMLDEQSGEREGPGGPAKSGSATAWPGGEFQGTIYPKETGGASRFFYTAKADRDEREEGIPGRVLRPRHGRQGARSDDPNGLRRFMDDTREPGKPGGMNPRNLPASVARANFHPTVKPLDLMRYLVRLVTPPSGLVLDPFLGSGTTLLACRLEGFSGFGIEKEAEYEEIIKGRMSSIPPAIESFL
jgi:site-specific DNA-methyltransferase (adenine-specific)